MLCTFLDICIAPRSKSKTLYTTQNRDKKITQLYANYYLNYLVVSILAAQYNPVIISGYNYETK